MPISKWIFPHAPGSLCLAKLQNIPTLLCTWAGGAALTQGTWKVSVTLSVWKSGCFAQPTKSMVQFWLANNQPWLVIKTEKSRRKLGHWSCLLDSAACPTVCGFSHTHPGHWVGIIQVTHSFLLFMFQNKSVLSLKTAAFSVLACKNPLSEHGQTF